MGYYTYNEPSAKETKTWRVFSPSGNLDVKAKTLSEVRKMHPNARRIDEIRDGKNIRRMG